MCMCTYVSTSMVNVTHSFLEMFFNNLFSMHPWASCWAVTRPQNLQPFRGFWGKAIISDISTQAKSMGVKRKRDSPERKSHPGPECGLL